MLSPMPKSFWLEHDVYVRELTKVPIMDQHWQTELHGKFITWAFLGAGTEETYTWVELNN